MCEGPEAAGGSHRRALTRGEGKLRRLEKTLWALARMGIWLLMAQSSQASKPLSCDSEEQA